MNQEIADNSRACCNCANATMSYPNCSCWQHKHCNGDRPYVILKEAWIKTAEECEEFELGIPEEADVYLELHRIMSEESKDKNPKPMPSCKSCGFYENNCPYIRGKFIPYPKKVCKDYTYSVKQEQPEVAYIFKPNMTIDEMKDSINGKQPEVDLEKEIDEKWDEFVSSEGEREDFTRTARHFYELGLNARK